MLKLSRTKITLPLHPHRLVPINKHSLSLSFEPGYYAENYARLEVKCSNYPGPK